MDKRPINLNLFSLHWPIPAIVSFLHRVSGVVLFLLIPCLLWVLNESLASEAQFELLKVRLGAPWIQFLLWSFLAALLYHLIAGIRHLLMDIHLGESKMGGRVSAYLVLFLFAVGVLIAAYWIWH